MKKFDNAGWIIIVAVLCRLFGVVTIGDPGNCIKQIENGSLREQFYRMLSVNNDELLIAEVSLNYCNGRGFTSHENVRTGYLYDFTAYRPTYAVYTHIAAIKIYHKIFPSATIKLEKRDPYFLAYGFLLHMASLAVFIVSLFFFRMVALYFLDLRLSNMALLLYGFHPAVMLYVGNFANYESIATSLLIINVALLLKACREKLSWKVWIVFTLVFIISVVYRPQLNFIYFFLFGFFLLITFWNKNQFNEQFKQAVKWVVCCFIVFMAVNTPVLIKNYRLFNGFTLATTGFNFHQGHNPYARGSWDGRAWHPDSPYYKYVREKIPGYNEMDEFEKSEQIQKLAIKWIKENPGSEIMLTIRKIAIYFLPENYDHHFLNPVTLVYHLGTVLYCLLLFYQGLLKRKVSGKDLILISPLAGSLLVSGVFHVGYRWRYYAEPFMIIMTLIVISGCIRLYLYQKNRKA